MNLFHLRYFMMLAEEQHYTRAAEKLCITQPSLSNAINQLEKELGIRLFEKEGRRIHLTELGKRADISHRYFHRQMVHAVANAMPESDRAALIDGLMVLNEFFQSKADDLTHKSDDKGATSAGDIGSASQGGKEVRSV